MKTDDRPVRAKQMKMLHARAADAKRRNSSPYHDLQSRKMAIAQSAADLLADGDIVFINSSSTAMLVYSLICGKSVTIVTNNCSALDLPGNPHVELLLTGGEIAESKHALVGELALSPLTRITASKCILGINGISEHNGMSSHNIQETAVNRLMLQKCNGPKIIVADGSKIGSEDRFSFSGLSEITHLITDTSADPEELDQIRKAGVTVTVVEP